MSQISAPEALDLVNKFLTERIPLRCFFVTPAGVQVAMPGFVDSIKDGELAISVSGPPLDNSRGWINVPLAGSNAWYGEKRELSEDIKTAVESQGDSVLRFDFPSGNTLAIFFTL